MCKKLICLVSFVLVLGLALTSVGEAATDLVGHWKFDEGSGNIAKDSSGNGHDGTFNGNPQWVEGQLGGALDFDGDDSVEIPHHPSLSITDEITVTAWAKIRAGAGGELAIISKGGWGANDLPFELTQVPGGPTCWQFYDDGGRDMCNPPTLPEEEWHHIAGTYDGQSFKIYYDGVLEEEEAYVGTMPENTAPVTIGQRSRGGTLASEPTPTDEATDVPRDVTLSWTPGELANTHDVYLGTAFDDVNDADAGSALLVSAGQSATTYEPPSRLQFGQTYYWRVDEVNAPPDSTVYAGEVWSFTTEPVAYPIDGVNINATASSASQPDVGPENTINGSGLDVNDLHSTEPTDMWLSGSEPLGAWIQYEFDRVYKLHEMWVWNSNQLFEASFLGFGLRDVTVEYSTDGVDWTALVGAPEFAQAPGADGYAHNTTVDFGGKVAKYVKLTATSNWAGLLPQYGLSEVRIFYVPVNPREPSPDSGATEVDVNVTLSWRAGREAATHDLYLSTDEQAVIDATAPAVNPTDTSYSSLPLDLASTYHWRIDEANEAETPTTWQGDVWDFTTQEFIVVDGFEDYNDWPPDEIYTTWKDGYEDPANGAQVGNLLPSFAESAIVHGGDQSMPLFYSNTGGATHSEGTRTFAVPQDWTRHGIQTLVLYFHGAPGNTGQMYVRINGTRIPYDGDPGNIAQPRWQPWTIDLTLSGVNLQSIASLTIGVDGVGTGGTLYFDDIRLYRQAPPLPSEEIWIEAEAGILGTSWSTIDDATASGGKYIGSTEEDGDDSDTAPGAEWLATYTFDVAGGDYKVFARGNQADSDSFWFRITTATGQNLEDPDQPGTGWVMWNGMAIPSSPAWGWDDVHSNDHDDEAIIWTLPAGTHTLEVAKREDGTNLDAILIVDDVE